MRFSRHADGYRLSSGGTVKSIERSELMRVAMGCVSPAYELPAFPWPYGSARSRRAVSQKPAALQIFELRAVRIRRGARDVDLGLRI